MASLEEATTLSASQMAFFADDELVTIIPSEPLPELSLISVCDSLHEMEPCLCIEQETDCLVCFGVVENARACLVRLFPLRKLKFPSGWPLVCVSAANVSLCRLNGSLSNTWRR